MSEEQINEMVKEHYGFSVEEIDDDVGKLSLRVKQLEYNNEKLMQEKQLLIKEKIRLLVIIKKVLKTNIINGEDMKIITKLNNEKGSVVDE